MAGKERKVYFSGSIIPESEARISIYDSALMFGDMVFEMTRSFNKVQFNCGTISSGCTPRSGTSTSPSR